ncbi:MAG: hypothetical protein LBH29_00765 [Elusimicrobiota bacterium]|nr:hypothetical protein [Elusimicrobiota bacterium]
MRLKVAIAPAELFTGANSARKLLKNPFCCWHRQIVSLVVIAKTPGVIPSQDGIPVCYKPFTFSPFVFEKRKETATGIAASAAMTPGRYVFAPVNCFNAEKAKQK